MSGCQRLCVLVNTSSATCIQLESLRLSALEEQERLTAQAATLAAELEEARMAAAAAEPLQAELEQVTGWTLHVCAVDANNSCIPQGLPSSADPTWLPL